MAKTEKLLLDIQVKNQQALGKLNRNVDRLRGSTLSLGTAAKAALGAFTALGAAKIAGNFLQVNRQVENLGLRLKFLFNSAEEGAKAFDTLTKFAGQVPFSLEEIAAAAGNLAVVSKDAEELGKNLAITGNVAAISGLDFKTAGEQIQRALSGGISAADLLRERGIKAILGFKDGVKITTEETAEALERDFGPDGKFGQAAEALANTFDGILSMVGDKMFQFNKTVGEAGAFDQLKAAVGLFDDFLEGRLGDINATAEKLGQGFVTSTEQIILGAGSILDALSPVIRFTTDSFNNIVSATNGLPGYIKALGVFGFLALGIKGKLVVVAIGAVADEIAGIFADLTDFIAGSKEKLAGFLEAIGMKEKAKELRENGASMRGEAEALRNKFKDLGKGFGETEDDLDAMLMKMADGTLEEGKFTKAGLKMIKMLRDKREELKGVEEELNANIEATKQQEEQLGAVEEAIRSYKDGFLAAKDSVNVLEEINKAGARTFKGMEDALVKFVMTGKFNFKDFANSVIQDLIRIAVRKALVFAIDTATGGLGSIIGSFFGRAAGGPVAAGRPYMVGEQGPELFVPQQTGSVVPNTQMGAAVGGEVTVNFNINAVDAASFDELLLSRKGLIVGTIQQAFRQQGRRFA